MQGDELKRLRTARGLDQSKVADALGLSRVFVGMMERDQKPIEPRTALAARLLYDRYDVQRVEAGDYQGWYMVVRRTLSDGHNPKAIASFVGTSALYGLFRRRDHAYRWIAALKSSRYDPRCSHLVRRQRITEYTG